MESPYYKTSKEKMERRVDRGIAKLNAERPGWYRHINLDTLDLSSGFCCTLGQEFHDDYYEDIDRASRVAAFRRERLGITTPYDFGYRKLKLRIPEKYGFCLIEHDYKLNDYLNAWGELTELWRAKIKALQDADPEYHAE